MPEAATIKLIIHGASSGPDYHRLLAVLALKNVPWTRSCGLPSSIEPLLKADRPLPVMQYGPCFFEGSMIAMLALEQLQPLPSLFPNGNCGMPLALGWWSDAFYRDVSLSDGSSLLAQHCTLIARQIADGRDYLQGPEPGLADVNSFAPLKALVEHGHDLSPDMNAMPLLASWYQRMDVLKAGSALASLPVVPPRDYPECDSIGDRLELDRGAGILWRSSLI